MRGTPGAVLLLGPTASGKSALAMELARRIPLEIVSLDSALVYRGLDIGAAKPSARDRELVPHHLLDLRDPAQPYSAAQWREDALAAMGEIARRGRLALVVGGTMMYARVLLQGIAPLPPADAGVRARLEEEAARLGWPALHERLAVLDPATAGRLSPNDRQRIGRALEVLELAGEPLSRLIAGPPGGPSRGLALPVIALLPADRKELHRRIERRLDDMLAAGFLAEVQALRARGDLDPSLPALRAVGYRQAWVHLERGTPIAHFRDEALAATRQLARRQLTWLRSMQDVERIDPFADGALEQVEESLRRARAT